MKTVLYCRVSTLDQTLAHQQTQAQAAGFQIDEVVADHGVSGIHTALRERAEGRRLFDMLRAGDTLVVRWVDRLGRNYADVTDTIRNCHILDSEDDRPETAIDLSHPSQATAAIGCPSGMVSRIG